MNCPCTSMTVTKCSFCGNRNLRFFLISLALFHRSLLCGLGRLKFRMAFRARSKPCVGRGRCNDADAPSQYELPHTSRHAESSITASMSEKSRTMIISATYRRGRPSSAGSCVSRARPVPVVVRICVACGDNVDTITAENALNICCGPVSRRFYSCSRDMPHRNRHLLLDAHSAVCQC